MNPYPKVAIIYLSYHCKDDLPAAVEAWKKLTYPRARFTDCYCGQPASAARTFGKLCASTGFAAVGPRIAGSGLFAAREKISVFRR